MALFFTAYREEGKSCEYFVNIGVHFVQLQVEDVEGDGGHDVQEGEDVSNKIEVNKLAETKKPRYTTFILSLLWMFEFNGLFHQKLRFDPF